MFEAVLIVFENCYGILCVGRSSPQLLFPMSLVPMTTHSQGTKMPVRRLTAGDAILMQQIERLSIRFMYVTLLKPHIRYWAVTKHHNYSLASLPFPIGRDCHVFPAFIQKLFTNVTSSQASFCLLTDSITTWNHNYLITNCAIEIII